MKNSASSEYLDQIQKLKNWFDGEGPLLVRTSGTTGKPKSISLAREHVLHSAQLSVDFFGLNEQSLVLLALPLDKIGGIMLLMRALVANAEIFPVDPSLDVFSNLDPDIQFDFASMVPNQLEYNLKHIHRVKQVLVGGGPVHQDLMGQLTNTKTQIWHSYASTETISHVALRSLNPELERGYTALPGISFAVNAEDELIVKAPALGIEALQTKDRIELYDPQQFRWIGRSDNVVLSGGYKIYPEDLEANLVLSFPFFLDGIEDRSLGERLILVLKEEDYDPGIVQELRAVLKGPERPKSIYLVPHFIYTENGKLKRKETKAIASFKEEV